MKYSKVKGCVTEYRKVPLFYRCCEYISCFFKTNQAQFAALALRCS